MAGGDLAGGKTLQAATSAFICFEDEAGVTGRPPKGRTWGRRGTTPRVKVSGRIRGRLSVAGLPGRHGLRRLRRRYLLPPHRLLSAVTTKHSELVLAAAEMGLRQRDREGNLRVPINHPDWSGGVLVLVRCSARSVSSADLQVSDVPWRAARFG